MNKFSAAFERFGGVMLLPVILALIAFLLIGQPSTWVTLTVAGVKDVTGGLLTTEETLRSVDGRARETILWIELSEGADPAPALEDVTEALNSAEGPVVSVYSIRDSTRASRSS